MGIGQRHWLALIVGNSRWHWGAFENSGPSLLGDRWLGSWHTPQLAADQVKRLVQADFAIAAWNQLGLGSDLPPALYHQGAGGERPELWAAAVVASPLVWLADYPALHRVETPQVPLQHTYPSLGVDRALALLGAGETWGWPVLVIDGGTALTFTAGDTSGFLGGAILPGLRMQLGALHAHTGQLPQVEIEVAQWPPRWAKDTAGAIASGILHTQLAGIRDFMAAWELDWPNGVIVLTGGDSSMLLAGLNQRAPELAHRVKLDPDLVYWGLRVCRQRQLL